MSHTATSHISKPEVAEAIEGGIQYWQDWFSTPGKVNYDTAFTWPRSEVLLSLTGKFRNEATARAINDGTRELAFTAQYGDPAAYKVFSEIVHQMILHPHERDLIIEDVRRHEEFSEPVLHMARLAATACETDD